ncbi:protein of unknown function [Tenacibaculum aestuariivivum]
MLVIYKLTKILGGFPIPFLFTILGARNTQQIIYKIVGINYEKNTYFNNNNYSFYIMSFSIL